MDADFVVLPNKRSKGAETPVTITCPIRAPRGGLEAAKHMVARVKGALGAERYAACTAPCSTLSTVSSQQEGRS